MEAGQSGFGDLDGHHVDPYEVIITQKVYSDKVKKCAIVVRSAQDTHRDLSAHKTLKKLANKIVK